MRKELTLLSDVIRLRLLFQFGSVNTTIVINSLSNIRPYSPYLQLLYVKFFSSPLDLIAFKTPIGFIRSSNPTDF